MHLISIFLFNFKTIPTYFVFILCWEKTLFPYMFYGLIQVPKDSLLIQYYSSFYKFIQNTFRTRFSSEKRLFFKLIAEISSFELFSLLWMNTNLPTDLFWAGEPEYISIHWNTTTKVFSYCWCFSMYSLNGWEAVIIKEYMKIMGLNNWNRMGKKIQCDYNHEQNTTYQSNFCRCHSLLSENIECRESQPFSYSFRAKLYLDLVGEHLRTRSIANTASQFHFMLESQLKKKLTISSIQNQYINGKWWAKSQPKPTYCILYDLMSKCLMKKKKNRIRLLYTVLLNCVCHWYVLHLTRGKKTHDSLRILMRHFVFFYF